MSTRTALPNTTLDADYERATPGSARLAGKARTLMPSGLSHDSRNFDPYPIYVTHARGPVKWDVDGYRYVDYFGGHGALILGHNHPKVLAAVHAQLDRGTHYGACHELEVRWAELVCELVPSAERVRFTSSGTEATLLALRLARAFTGRPKLVRFKGHFHGWHDHMTQGHTSHFDGTPTAGVVDGVAGEILLAEPNDVAGITRIFEQYRRDIAAVILEPTGANFGRMPLRPDFIATLRRLTSETGALLIFDEVVTGFRVSVGGAQAHLGINPDLTTLAKILGGGLPGGAVAGRREILDVLDFKATKVTGIERVYHPGTFNANPLSAAAGVATLEILASTDACERANRYGEELRSRLNAVLEEEKLPWAAHGSFSGFHIFTNPEGRDIRPGNFDPYEAIPLMLGKSRGAGITSRVRLGMLVNGIDLNSGPSGTISIAHGEEEMAATVEALRMTVRALRRQGELP